MSLQLKAIRMPEFGRPEMLQVKEVARPIPAPDEILVRVRYPPRARLQTACRLCARGAGYEAAETRRCPLVISKE